MSNQDIKVDIITPVCNVELYAQDVLPSVMN